MFEGPGTVLAADSKKRGGRRFTGRPHHPNISFAHMVGRTALIVHFISESHLQIFYLEDQDTLMESRITEDEEVKDMKASLNWLPVARPTSSGLCWKLQREISCAGEFPAVWRWRRALRL